MRNYLYILFSLILFLFAGCQKNTDVNDPDAVSKIAKNPLTLTLPATICADKEFEVSLKFENKMPGKMQIRISSDEGSTWSTAAENNGNTITTSDNFFLKLPEGNYSIQGIFIPARSGSEITRTEIEKRKVFNYSECEGLVLDPDLEGKNYIVHPGQVQKFTAEYTVLACDQDYKDLVLKGSINPKAVYRSFSPEASSQSGSFFRWNLGDVKTGFQKSFKISFDLEIPAAPYGTLVPVTGAFILEGKTADGRPAVVGDYNEIFVQIQ